MNFDEFKSKVSTLIDEAKVKLGVAKDKIGEAKEQASETIHKLEFKKVIETLYYDGILTEEEKAFAMGKAAEIGVSEEQAREIIAEAEAKHNKQ